MDLEHSLTCIQLETSKILAHARTYRHQIFDSLNPQQITARENIFQLLSDAQEKFSALRVSYGLERYTNQIFSTKWTWLLDWSAASDSIKFTDYFLYAVSELYNPIPRNDNLKDFPVEILPPLQAIKELREEIVQEIGINWPTTSVGKDFLLGTAKFFIGCASLLAVHKLIGAEASNFLSATAIPGAAILATSFQRPSPYSRDIYEPIPSPER